MTAEQMALQIEMRYKTPVQFRLDLAADLQAWRNSSPPDPSTEAAPVVANTDQSVALAQAHAEIATLLGELSQVRAQLAQITSNIQETPSAA